MTLYVCPICLFLYPSLVCTQVNSITHYSSGVVPADQVTQHSCPVVPMHPHQSTPTQYPHGDSNYYTTTGAPLGGRTLRVLGPTLQAAYRSQQSVPMVSHSLVNQLTDDHHAVLLKQLTRQAAAWREIGTYLGFG